VLADDEPLPTRNPLSLSARQRRHARTARDDAKARTQFLGVVVGSCLAVALVFALAVWIAHPETPPDLRTADEWGALLRAPEASVRADAVRDLAELSSTPALPCDLLVARLTDAAAVRIESVALLSTVAAQGRCVDELTAVLEHAAEARSRIAAAQVLGAAGTTNARRAVPILVRALADSSLRNAAVVALGRIGDSSATVREALQHLGQAARGETLGDVLAALLELGAGGEVVRPIVGRALADSLGTVRAAALTDLWVMAATSTERALAMRQAIAMLRGDRDVDVRAASARLLATLPVSEAEATAAVRVALQDTSRRVRDAARAALRREVP
jgi:hypothetical protein